MKNPKRFKKKLKKELAERISNNKDVSESRNC